MVATGALGTVTNGGPAWLASVLAELRVQRARFGFGPAAGTTLGVSAGGGVMLRAGFGLPLGQTASTVSVNLDLTTLVATHRTCGIAGSCGPEYLVPLLLPALTVGIDLDAS